MHVKKSVRKTSEIVFSISVIALMLASCGGSGPVGSAGGSATISGVAVKGLMKGAKATAYEVDSKGRHIKVLGTSNTSSLGEFSIPLSAQPTTPISVEISGGSYISEKDGTSIIATSPIYALIPHATSGIAVTPLTDMARARALALAASGVTLGTAITDADSLISRAFALSAPSPSSIVPEFSTAALTAKSDAGKVALAVAALDGLAQKLAANLGIASRDDIYAALSEDYSDGLPDGKNAAGMAVTITSASAALPASAMGYDLASEIGAVSAVVFAGPAATSADLAIAAAAISSADVALAPVKPIVGATVTSIVPSTVLSATGVSSSSSGAMSYTSIAGKQYLYVAARNKGVRKIDITNPAAPVEITAPTWNGGTLSTNVGYGGAPIGGAMIVSSSTGVYVLAFAYAAKHVALLNPDNGSIVYEGALPIVSTTMVSFSGGSAFIAGAIPVPGKGAWMATADGYVFFDINASLAAAAGSAPVLTTKHTTPPGVQIAENLGGDIANNYLLAPSSAGQKLGIVNLSTVGSLVTPGFYSLDTTYAASHPVATTSYIDGGAVDTAWGVGVLSYEDTSNVSFINMNGISAGTALNTFVPVATNGFVDVPLGGGTFSGTAVDSGTHQVFGMAGYSTDIFVGQLENPTTAGAGAWKGMSDWVYYKLTAYASAADPHAVATVFNTQTNKTYGYVLDGSTSPAGLRQIDVSGLLALPRTSVGAHTVAAATNPSALGGPITTITLAP